MRLFRTGSASALLLAAHALALAQSEPEPVQQVLVQADAGAARSRSTTTNIVVGREELLRHGDTALAEVLKRQPGISVDATPGKAPAIRMRGMGSGYVALLLNGLPAPNGFSLESMGVDAIERIEIMRAATVETSGQAMAGTINVILRRAGAGKNKAQSEIKAGSAVVDGYAAPQLAFQHSGRAGPLAYTLAATLKRTENPVSFVATEEGEVPLLLRRTAVLDHQMEDVLELSPRLSWQPNGRDTLTSQSHVRRRHIDNGKRERETVEAGLPTAFAHADSGYETSPLHAYADLAWTRRFEDGARLTTKLSGFYTQRDARFVYRGMAADGQLLETHRVASGPLEREWTFNGSWRRPWSDSHALAAGWEFGRKGRSEYRREQQSDAGGTLLRATDEHYRARVARSAFFVQDEWDIDRSWSAYLGLRREDLHTTGKGNADAAVDVDAGAWSPILQTLFKPSSPEGAPRDQLRFALTRTYKAPDIVELMPRRYTVDNNNSATHPDQQGNPNLRPELALGVDVAWERHDADRGGGSNMVGVSVFHKRIRDITLERIEQRGGVWVATPDNRGNATVRGIEFEGTATRGPLTVRLNLARNWSRVDAVAGPDNRIADQPACTGNLGLDYTAKHVELGGNYSYRGRIAYRSNAYLFNENGIKRQLDLYAVWKRDAASRLRLAVSDLLHPDYRESVYYHGENTFAQSTRFRVRTTWRLVWEQAL